MTEALNPKLLLPVLAIAADVPLNGVLLRLLKLVSCLALTAANSVPEVASTGEAEVDGTVVEPNPKTGVAGNEGAARAEVERLLLLVMVVVEVAVRVELLDEF